MNKNILQIFITRSFFVVASQFLYQRVQGEKTHPMAPLSDVWESFLALRNRSSIFYQATAYPASCLPMWLPSAVNHTICFAYYNPLVITNIITDSPQLCWRWIYTIGCYYYDFFFFLLLLFFHPRHQLILGQTHDEMENGKLATHINENFRPSSLIDQYPITW